MKLLLQTLIVFFATLLTAGLVALGEPNSSGRQPAWTALKMSAPAPQRTVAPVQPTLASWQAESGANSSSVAR